VKIAADQLGFELPPLCVPTESSVDPFDEPTRPAGACLVDCDLRTYLGQIPPHAGIIVTLIQMERGVVEGLERELGRASGERHLANVHRTACASHCGRGHGKHKDPDRLVESPPRWGS